MKYRTFLKAALVLATAASGTALAAEFPQRPVTIVVGYSPGGSNDKVSRVLGQQLSKIWGQPVVIDNRAGAAGAIAAAHVARSKPDGLTLMVGPVTLTMIPAVQKNLPFDLAKDFTPIALIAKSPLALTVSASLDVKTVNDFIALAKKRDLFAGTTGPGAIEYFATYDLMAKSAIKLEDINYKGGSEILMDLIANRVNMSFSSVAMVAQQVREGKLKALAVSGDERSAVLPGVPTLSESGVKNFDIQQWWGLFAPSGTPPEIIEKINKDVNTSLQNEQVKQSLLADGAVPSPMSTGEFKKFVKQEFDAWQKLAKDSNMPVQ